MHVRQGLIVDREEVHSQVLPVVRPQPVVHDAGLGVEVNGSSEATVFRVAHGCCSSPKIRDLVALRLPVGSRPRAQTPRKVSELVRGRRVTVEVAVRTHELGAEVSTSGVEGPSQLKQVPEEPVNLAIAGPQRKHLIFEGPHILLSCVVHHPHHVLHTLLLEEVLVVGPHVQVVLDVAVLIVCLALDAVDIRLMPNGNHDLRRSE
mmetsp:Transcript_18776/g.40988  ORF Transcript_18776/g.40988 Transcript_18776/m.40988 type:complete len:205 (+) Transcript_18776:715-1329(+)